jgi:elongation factor P
MIYQTSDFRNGLKVLIDSQPYVMTYFQFVKPGKGTAFTRTKLKNLITGNVIERTFRTGETVEAADCEDRNMQFMYQDGESYEFMDMESYDQMALRKDMMEGGEDFLTDGLEVMVTLFNGRPVGLTLPNFVEDTIEYCEPGVRGNTAQGATKPATLACGATVQVPLFIERGEVIRVDTRTRSYVSRVRE